MAKIKFLEELLGQLINAADNFLPGKDGAEKEKWATEKLKAYIESQDEEFVTAIIEFTRLPVPSDLIKTIVDNPFVDGIEEQAVNIICKTAIRLAYGSEFLKKYITRKPDMTEEEEKEFNAVRDALLAEKAEPSADEAEKPASKASSKASSKN